MSTGSPLTTPNPDFISPFESVMNGVGEEERGGGGFALDGCLLPPPSEMVEEGAALFPIIEKRGKRDAEKKPSVVVVQGPKPGKAHLSFENEASFVQAETAPSTSQMPPPPPSPTKDGKEKDLKEGNKDEKNGKIPQVVTFGNGAGRATQKPAAEKPAIPPKVAPDGGNSEKAEVPEAFEAEKAAESGSATAM
ncbi:hypothetical protein NL676_000870 [Syzygium grande]|nr:hypothetical protein NL676_000870 [Syzygium grande]